MQITNPRTKHLFSQAYIIGGAPCSGKSTIAKRLSQEFKFQYYKTDDHERAHSKKINPDFHPIMNRYAMMSWNEILMRPVQDQVDEELEYYRERFEMIVHDIEKYDMEQLLLLEGAAYLPELLAKNGADRKRVIFNCTIMVTGLGFITFSSNAKIRSRHLKIG